MFDQNVLCTVAKFCFFSFICDVLATLSEAGVLLSEAVGTVEGAVGAVGRLPALSEGLSLIHI